MTPIIKLLVGSSGATRLRRGFQAVQPYFAAAEYTRPFRVRDPGLSSCGVVFLGENNARQVRITAYSPRPTAPSQVLQHFSKLLREQWQHRSALVSEQGRRHLCSSGSESEPVQFGPTQHLHSLAQCICSGRLGAGEGSYVVGGAGTCVGRGIQGWRFLPPSLQPGLLPHPRLLHLTRRFSLLLLWFPVTW